VNSRVFIDELIFSSGRDCGYCSTSDHPIGVCPMAKKRACNVGAAVFPLHKEHGEGRRQVRCTFAFRHRTNTDARSEVLQ
jgi:hypothetical protein